MKKVMFIIVGMLFSVSASAATLQFDGGVADAYSITDARIIEVNEVGFSEVFNFSVSVESVEVGSTFIEFLGSAFDVTSVTLSGTNIMETAFISDGGATIESWSLMPSMLLGVGDYTITALISSTTGGVLSANVSAVPVPAALFLFAPVLLGFLGLRRKAAVA